MSTSPLVPLSGRLDVHRLDELRGLAPNTLIDASAVDFIDGHALDALEALPATIVSPSDVVRITLELTRSPLPCFGSAGAAIGHLVGAE